MVVRCVVASELHLDKVNTIHIGHFHLKVMSAGLNATIVPSGMPIRLDIVVDQGSKRPLLRV